MPSTRLLSDYVSLTIAQKKALEKGGFSPDPAAILLLSPQDVAKKLRLTLQQVLDLIEGVAKDNVPTISRLTETEDGKSFTTGDERIDSLLGGGICAEQIYDICGESASGKTQLALQLALCVQLPEPDGLSGSTAYITTSSRLATDRLLQIKNTHPLLSHITDQSALDRVHTSACKTPEMLINTLTYSLRKLAESAATSASPLRLIIIDSIAWLFRTDTDKAISSTLFERSKLLSHIAYLLRGLARDFGLAVVVLNHVSTVFDSDRPAQQAPPSQGSSSSAVSQAGSEPPIHTITYRDQASWFAAPGPGSRNEASLGLVWANEVNTRLMLSRTQYRHYCDTPDGRPLKRRRTADGGAVGLAYELEEGYARVRRMDLIFSPDAPPANVDFVIAAAGVKSIADVELANRRKRAEREREGEGQAEPASDVTVTAVTSVTHADTSGISAEELAKYAEALDYPSEDEKANHDDDGGGAHEADNDKVPHNGHDDGHDDEDEEDEDEDEDEYDEYERLRALQAGPRPQRQLRNADPLAGLGRHALRYLDEMEESAYLAMEGYEAYED